MQLNPARKHCTMEWAKGIWLVSGISTLGWTLFAIAYVHIANIFSSAELDNQGQRTLQDANLGGLGLGVQPEIHLASAAVVAMGVAALALRQRFWKRRPSPGWRLITWAWCGAIAMALSVLAWSWLFGLLFSPSMILGVAAAGASTTCRFRGRTLAQGTIRELSPPRCLPGRAFGEPIM